MAPPEQFARNIRRLGRNIERNATELKRRVAVAVLSTVVPATPVDTGRARSNWLVSLGVATRATRATRGTGAVQATINEGTATINQAQEEVDIVISNNLRYIGRLNEGSSAQAPAGFVQLAVSQGLSIARAGRVVRRR